ncbi:hypothetical protein [Paenibacillus sp. 843]|uniref:hypothetical protein n=1 Tax=Paenibacillus sp. 843 TaxID=3341795 RepID=UPI00372D11F1
MKTSLPKVFSHRIEPYWAMEPISGVSPKMKASPMNEMDIQPWLIRMSQGDEEAFQAVYDLTRDQAFGLIYYLAPSKHDVLDIMSEVYEYICE